MSVKTQFLKKIQIRQSDPVAFTRKTLADIAEFRLRITQLQAQMDAWLVDTGLNVETFMVSVTDLLVEGGAFETAGIALRYDDRAVKFTPVFLYGQGVTGCVEASFHNGGLMTPLGRLFMRSDTLSGWAFAPPGALSRPGAGFDENTFFSLILALVP